MFSKINILFVFILAPINSSFFYSDLDTNINFFLGVGGDTDGDSGVASNSVVEIIKRTKIHGPLMSAVNNIFLKQIEIPKH